MTGKCTIAVNSRPFAFTMPWFLRGTHSSTLGSPPGTSIRGGSFTHSSTFCRWSLPIFSFSLSARTAPIALANSNLSPLVDRKNILRILVICVVKDITYSSIWREMTICMIYSVLVDMISKLPQKDLPKKKSLPIRQRTTRFSLILQILSTYHSSQSLWSNLPPQRQEAGWHDVPPLHRFQALTKNRAW